MKLTAKPAANNALLISITTPDFKGDEAKESLAELARLVTTLGFKVVGTQSQHHSSSQRQNVLGAGKLAEIAHLTGYQGSIEEAEDEDFLDESGLFDSEIDELDFDDLPTGNFQYGAADVVVFDCDLSPSQMRTVEASLGVEVFDRTGIIIEIFSRHARTRTARLQVDIARLNYSKKRERI